MDTGTVSYLAWLVGWWKAHSGCFPLLPVPLVVPLLTNVYAPIDPVILAPVDPVHELLRVHHDEL